MKLATFQHDGREAIGAVIDDGQRLVDLATARHLLGGPPSPWFVDMLALIDAGDAGLGLATETLTDAPETAILNVDDITLLAPLPVPRQMRDFIAFEEHLQNTFKRASKISDRKQAVPDVWYERPLYYKANRFSVVGSGADIRWPAYAELLDYELELACVIGRRGVDIAEADAHRHIFGFTIFNDVSARDTQMAEMSGRLGPAKGKDFDTGNVLGPWIVTRDEIGDYNDLTMVARINGEELSRGNSGAMHYTFDRIIAYVSQSETIHAGEVLGSGTVGTGCGLEHGRFLGAGDIVELEIDRIGVLRNRVFKDGSNKGEG